MKANERVLAEHFNLTSGQIFEHIGSEVFNDKCCRIFPKLGSVKIISGKIIAVGKIFDSFNIGPRNAYEYIFLK